MMLAVENTCVRAVVKNTFLHIEKIGGNFDKRHLGRRRSDASLLRPAALSELLCAAEASNNLSIVACRVEPEFELGLGGTPLHNNCIADLGEMMEEQCPETTCQRKDRRCQSDGSHARDADAQFYKVDKGLRLSKKDNGLEALMLSTPRFWNAPVSTEDDAVVIGAAVLSCAKSGRCSNNSGEDDDGQDELFVPQESSGSAGHYEGLCRPCVWFWRPTSCSKGWSCEYCHLCDEEAVSRSIYERKAMKKQRIKLKRHSV